MTSYCMYAYMQMLSTCFQTLDNGLNVIQLETAVGAAIKNFEGAMGESSKGP